MTEPRVNYEVAKLLKEAGFDWEVTDRYYDHMLSSDLLKDSTPDNWNVHDYVYSVPTLSHACMWLREVHGLHVYALIENEGEGMCHYYPAIQKVNGGAYFDREFGTENMTTTQPYAQELNTL